MKNCLTYLLFTIILLLSARCSDETDKNEEKESAEVPNAPITLDIYSREIDSIYNLLSDEEKVWQLIWLDLSEDLALDKTIEIPAVAGYKDLERFSYNQTFLSRFDSSIVKPAIYTPSLWQNYTEFSENYEPQLFALRSIKDSAFLKEFYFYTAYNLKSRGSLFLLPETDSMTLADTNLSKLNSLYSELNNQGVLYSEDSLNAHSGNIHVSVDTAIIASTASHKVYYNLKHVTPDKFVDEVLLGDYDAALLQITSKDDLENFYSTISNALFSINPELLEYKVRKLIALKLRGKQKKEKDKLLPDSHIAEVKTKKHAYQLQYFSNFILNKTSSFPIKYFAKNTWRVDYVGKKNRKSLSRNFNRYNLTSVNKVSKISNLSPPPSKNKNWVIILHQQLDSSDVQLLTEKLNKFKQPYCIANVEYVENLKFLQSFNNVIQCHSNTDESMGALAQCIVGGNSITGIYPELEQNDKSSKIRLAYTIPEELDFHSDSIKRMKKIAQNAIWSKAMPGNQVFAAKDGKVFINVSHGHLTYSKKKFTTKNTVYDIASVTKVASTTLLGMHLYENGKYKIQDSLKLYLPDSLKTVLGHFSRLHNVNFHRLFTHTSGLPAGLPIYKFIAYVDSIIGKFDRYYCDYTNRDYCVQVAKDFYLDSAYLDSMWLDMNRIWTGTKKYKYSDANLNVLYQVFRQMIPKSTPYERYMDSAFYKPLGMKLTTFLPLDCFDTNKVDIAPTEYDTYWRYQLLKGHVHDPNAALYGGVAGNAGLFSTANDLGILFTMLLQHGKYGGRQYLSPSTVIRFTRHQEGSHRGLGFDKPTPSSGSVIAPDCPYTAYGHTGFTGICAWNDDENKITFVFTSNRVHPDPGNKKIITLGIRKRIHQVIYDQLYYNGTYKNKATGNVPATKIPALN